MESDDDAREYINRWVNIRSAPAAVIKLDQDHLFGYLMLVNCISEHQVKRNLEAAHQLTLLPLRDTNHQEYKAQVIDFLRVL
jgi:hypothetical protein